MRQGSLLNQMRYWLARYPQIPAEGGIATVRIPVKVEGNRLKIKMGIAVDAVPSLGSTKICGNQIKTGKFCLY